MIYGYIRLSALYLNPKDQLNDIGFTADAIFTDAYDTLTPHNLLERQRLLDTVQEGDVIHVHSLDRFFLDAPDFERVLHILHEKSVSLYSHKEDMLISSDTSSKASQLFLAIIHCMATWNKALQKEAREEQNAHPASVTIPPKATVAPISSFSIAHTSQDSCRTKHIPGSQANAAYCLPHSPETRNHAE
ncbi:MAG: recombinase family protein [Desulfovibrio sp.]|nr:recombinase family protein [Desulfovibrio sp.]